MSSSGSAQNEDNHEEVVASKGKHKNYKRYSTPQCRQWASCFPWISNILHLFALSLSLWLYYFISFFIQLLLLSFIFTTANNTSCQSAWTWPTLLRFIAAWLVIAIFVCACSCCRCYCILWRKLFQLRVSCLPRRLFDRRTVNHTRFSGPSKHTSCGQTGGFRVWCSEMFAYRIVIFERI